MKRCTRGGFLRLSAITGAGMVAAACAQATPVVIEKEVIKEVPVEKIVEKVDGELVSNATSGVFSQLALYVMAVADKYGHDEAFDLLSETYSKYGTQIGGMLKPQFEGREANAQDIFGVIGPMEESVGFELEMTDSTPEKVTMKFTRCPLYEGCQTVGAPYEEFCNNLGLPFVNAIARVLNPSAVWKDVRHRESTDDYCLEEITI